MKEKSVMNQYYLLIELLDSIKWQFDGQCEDIDCDKYLYRNCLKKKYKPALEHNFSCMPKLKRNHQAVMDLLSDKKFRKLRYKKCQVCKLKLDTLDDRNPISTFKSQRLTTGRFKGYQIKTYRTHKHCQKKLKPPEGFEPFL